MSHSFMLQFEDGSITTGGGGRCLYIYTGACALALVYPSISRLVMSLSTAIV